MLSKTVRVLLVEDDEDDYFLTRDVIGSIEKGRYAVTWLDTFDKALNALDKETFDVAFVDYRMGARTGIDFIAAAKAGGHDLPMIILTGLNDHDIDITASEAGAFDFLVKDELTPAKIERTIRFACAIAGTKRSLLRRTSVLQATLDDLNEREAMLNRNLGQR